MKKNKTILIVIVIIISYIVYNQCANKKIKEHLWINQNPNIQHQCNRVKEEKKPYISNWNTSNYSDAYDCYNKCLNDADCQYVGVGFDCYDNCFNNIVWP